MIVTKNNDWSEKRKVFISSIRNLFKSPGQPTTQSMISRERESKVEVLISRVTPQIIESSNLGLTWRTPEEWDRNFETLGGGQSRRKSSRILSRMTWEEFLELSSKIVETQD